MEKDFDCWNDKKKEIHKNGENKFYHSRDIWWCKLGLNIGSEQDGKDEDFQRPVLVIFGFGKTTCIVIPLTTSNQVHKYRISIGLVDGKEARAIISQMKVIDTKRFVEKIGVLDKKIFSTILKSVRNLF